MSGRNLKVGSTRTSRAANQREQSKAKTKPEKRLKISLLKSTVMQDLSNDVDKDDN